MSSIQKNIKNIRRKKRDKIFFTLFEVMCFLAIVGIVGAVIGMNIGKGVSKYRQEREYQKLKEKFFYIRQMAISNQCDLIVEMKQQKKSILLKIGTDEEMGIFPGQTRKKETFSSLYFIFHGEKQKTSSVRFLFSSTGAFYPKGKISFYKSSAFKKEIFQEIDLEDIALKEKKVFP